MVEEKLETGQSQADFIQNELNFDVDPEDPLTKASLEDHPENEWIDILGNGELKKKVLKAGGKNSRPNRGDICKAKITAKLEDGTIVEDHEEITFQLGDVEVIQGLDLAVALMDAGEEAEIVIAPRFAYGTLGDEPKIPPNATLSYTVELKSFEFEPESETLSISKRKEIGNKKRERGNWWFKRDEPTLAIQCYRRALEFLSPNKGGMSHGEDSVEETESDAYLQAFLEDRLTVENNLAAAQMKIEAYDAALKSVDNVLMCQPQNMKALFRKGKILHLKGENFRAYTIFLQVQKLDPQNKAVQQELSVIRGKTMKDVQKEKNLYRKMLGTKKEFTATKEVKKESKVKTTTIAWSIIGGTIVAAAGVIAYKLIS